MVLDTPFRQIQVPEATTKMEASRRPLQERWRILEPWCEGLKTQIKYKRIELEWGVWGYPNHRLEVSLPMRCQLSDDEVYDSGMEVWFYDGVKWGGETLFREPFQTFREALALLEAVAHVRGNIYWLNNVG
ncbi:hypothetical protein PC129_g17361 [Phytophthora cactorum]|uniref:Uncharacterized protein n=2 Tax=Phytophthora cactorum TaxID=29920 RepID=A0A8T1HK36_9STRA|nr:hypothetical protein PC114_g20982 [Phytophthora cactorum]KAG2908323.1 hypothetical protein PC117_g19988 [Phytophthora cactorum]KAG3211672.1 hypothetical protein PC129_g17361 [Phytophthora cactorum]